MRPVKVSPTEASPGSKPCRFPPTGCIIRWRITETEYTLNRRRHIGFLSISTGLFIPRWCGGRVLQPGHMTDVDGTLTERRAMV